MKKTVSLVALAVLLGGCTQMESLKSKVSGDESAETSSSSTQQTSAAREPQQTASNNASTERSSKTRAKQVEEESGIYGNPPAGSPFSKIKVGMSSRQVADLIGEPTDQKVYVTGKAWIPFYFGKDASRMEYRYKGQGVITLMSENRVSSAYKVYRVIYNPKEEGYN